MVQIIAGEKGKGKTKVLLNKVNEEILAVNGNTIYLDKSNKHMYELSNKVRLINVKEYLVENCNEFMGFLCGIASQDHDLEKIYLDSFLKIACCEDLNLETVFLKLTQISDMFHIDFVISISLNKEQIPLSMQDKIIVAL